MSSSKLTVPILINWNDIQSYMEQHDIVEVVRCKDCMYKAENFDPDRLYCKLWKHFVTAEWFCADGEMIEK